MKSTDIAFSRAVRTARIARGMTQGKLAVAAGVSRQFIVAIEGGHFPRSARYNALVAALGFSSPKDLMAAAETNSLSALKIALTVSASWCASRPSSQTLRIVRGGPKRARARLAGSAWRRSRRLQRGSPPKPNERGGLDGDHRDDSDHSPVTGVASAPVSCGTGPVESLAVVVEFTYGSGGTSGKVWVQTSLDGVTFFDVVCMTFLQASKSRLHNLTTASVTTPYVVTDGTLADDSVKNGLLRNDLPHPLNDHRNVRRDESERERDSTVRK